MNPATTYVPSRLLGGASDLILQHSLTRWMSRDLTQAATDFCRNLGLVPAYCEYSTEHLTRYLFWRLPSGAAVEVRSGRAKGKFEEFDRANCGRGWRLLSLHLNENDVYSAVWISADHFGIAQTFLAAHGVVTAAKKNV